MTTPAPDINQFFHQFHHKCTSIFNKTPRQWQVEVGGSILRSHHDNHEHNQLLIWKTGEGKSLVFLVSGACIGGVTLCISPLLSLAMDQSRKVLKHAPNTCTISSFHLDEMSPSLMDKLQTSLGRILPEVTTFIFTSPQCFFNRHRFRNFLFQQNLIKFVVVDEIHLFAQFGNTFRSKFCQLKKTLFDRLLQSPRKVPSLFMTATCTLPMVNDLEAMTGYTITNRHWPSPFMMSHRAVGIEVRYTHHNFRLLKTTIHQAINPLTSRPTIKRKVLIYSPTRNRAKSTSVKLGKYLDTTENLHNIDIITLVGTMTKEEKAYCTNLFLCNEDNPNYNPHIMCATRGVGNTGIDSSKIGIVYRLGMPESVPDLFQEKGRAGQYPDALSSKNRYILCFSIEDFLYLFKCISDLDEAVLNDAYCQRQIDDLMKMAKILASDQCMNVQMEIILGNLEMRHMLPPACGDCPVCTNAKLFPKINKEGTKTLLMGLFIFGEHGIKKKPNLKGLVTAVKAFPNVPGLLLSGTRTRKGIETGEIKKVLFMLLAHGIIKLCFDNQSKQVHFFLAKSFHNESILALQYDPYWSEMNSLVDLNN